jgi:hypothetical protein
MKWGEFNKGSGEGRFVACRRGGWRVKGRPLRMPRESKRRNRPKWDGMVVIGCHGSLEEGEDRPWVLICSGRGRCGCVSDD